MEKTITIKFSTGKEIQLTESEYEELKNGFQERKEIPIPDYPHYWWPYYPANTPWVGTGKAFWIADRTGILC